MRKKLLFLLICCLLLVGCGKSDEKSVLKELKKKVNNLEAYELEGDLNIVSNDESYDYDVSVSYKKDDKYNVSLINKSNNHEQLILKNSSGVYVVTPSLNKSFKFQSDWPNNNSQIYLLKNLVSDIENDEKRSFSKTSDGYEFVVEANYPNNQNLVKQKIKLDDDLNFTSVDVMNDDGVSQMIMKFKKIDTDVSLDDKIFEIDNIIDNSTNEESETNSKENNTDTNTNNSDNTNTDSTEKSEGNSNTSTSDENVVSSIDDIIYPLYIPTGTVLTDEEKVAKTDGERVILTFDGEKPFLLVEETVSVEDEFSIIPTYGEPFLLTDTFAALADNSISWTSGGIDYYLVSDVMSQPELIEIAQSVSNVPIVK